MVPPPSRSTTVMSSPPAGSSATAAGTGALSDRLPAGPPASLSVFTSSGSGSPSPGWQTPPRQVSSPSHGSPLGQGVPSGAGAADSQYPSVQVPAPWQTSGGVHEVPSAAAV